MKNLDAMTELQLLRQIAKDVQVVREWVERDAESTAEWREAFDQWKADRDA